MHLVWLDFLSISLLYSAWSKIHLESLFDFFFCLSHGCPIIVGWLFWDLCRINLCRLFNAKLCLYVYTVNQRFLTEYLVGKIFYSQDFICLLMINQF